MKPKKFLGIFISPDDVQNEGLDRVFANIQSVQADAISISPWISRPVADGKGSRVPDLHIDGHRRLFDRPLWGKRTLHLESFLTYEPDLTLYEAGAYPPPGLAAPPGLEGNIAQEMISEAKRRGMQAHIEILPFVPPGVHAEDQPVYVNGRRPQAPQIAFKACLNSPAAQAYGLAFIEDTMRNYPNVDGLFIDWAEYSAYLLEDHFACFCSDCEINAMNLGFDWKVIQKDVNALWDWLHELTSEKLALSLRLFSSPSALVEILCQFPGWMQFIQFKGQSVYGFYQQARHLLDDLGFRQVGVSARGWPPPWNLSSGLDFRLLAGLCDAVTPKLFTFDHAAMPRWYGQTLQRWNPDLSESQILDALVSWMNLPDDIEHRSFTDYQIPAPEESHPANIECYIDRLEAVVDQVDGKAHCYPYVHAYRPESQWKQTITMIRESRVDGMWVQMYGYLSDNKLKILADMWR